MINYKEKAAMTYLSTYRRQPGIGWKCVMAIIGFFAIVFVVGMYFIIY